MCSLCDTATHLCLAIIFILSFRAAGGSSQGQNEVMVLEGQEADLPCVTTPAKGQDRSTSDGRYKMGSHSSLVDHQQPDPLLLIVWYKDGIRSSIYSYDGRTPGRERHWSQRRSLGGHLNLTLPAGPHARPQLAFLKLSHAHQTDAGVYRCRVDFGHAPSRSTFTRLSIVVPSGSPTVEVWTGGRWLRTAQETPAATVEVGTNLRLRCSAAGGRPAPEVTWWRGGQQLLGEVAYQTDLVIGSVNVTVRSDDAHTPIVCQASNTHLTPPRRTPLQLLVLSSPSWVRVAGADGPMSVGVSYTVECRSKGARPPPVLTWSVGGQEQVHAMSTTDSKGETVSRLMYKPLPEHAGAHLTCTARPPDHAQSPHATPNLWAKSDSVPLNILYKPEVQLELQRLRPSSSEPLPRRPPFSPSTHKNKNLIPSEVDVSKTSSSSSSSSAMQKDSSKKTKGSKDGERLEDEGNDVSLVEGEGAVLQCHVRSNPPAFHISWYRDGKPLSSGRSPDVVVSNMSVVLRQLRRHDAGNYTCSAHNQEGTSRSNPVLLHVTHGPECLRDTAQVLGVPRHHPLNVTCQVAAHPPPTAFSWALKSSRGLLQVPSEMITSVGTTSWISYTPRAAVDYGELLCWAHTPAGRQRRPCVARLVPADKPDAPEQCKASRRTLHTITVSCTAAHDGGLPQTFFMRVFHSGQEVANSTSVTSQITAYDLEPNTRYRLTLWSANTHGTSRSTSLYASTAPVNSSSTSSSMNGHSSSSGRGPLATLGPSLLAVVVVVSVLGLVLGVVLGILTQRIAVPERSSHDSDDDDDSSPSEVVPSRARAPRGRSGESRRPRRPGPYGSSTETIGTL